MRRISTLLGPIAPKVAHLTLYCFVASPFENEARPQTTTYTHSLLVSLLSRTVVIRAGNDSEGHCHKSPMCTSGKITTIPGLFSEHLLQDENKHQIMNVHT